MDEYMMNARSVLEDGLHHHNHIEQERYYSDMSSLLTTDRRTGNNNHQKVQSSSSGEEEEDEMGTMIDLRRGPWTVEEDHTLISYIANHGEGRWNSLARCAGLKRTGKSCRLRWLNYLRPDVRRGNITLEEQLLILELHSRWGNRWSKIAQHLPGRTDNEIKNYWRTRVQKHAKQLKCDVNSKQFKDTMRYLWIPRLVERIKAAAAAANGPSSAQNLTTRPSLHPHQGLIISPTITTLPTYVSSENSSTNAASSDSVGTRVSPVSDMSETYQIPATYNLNAHFFTGCNGQIGYSDSLISPAGYYHPQCADFQSMEHNNNVDQWAVDGGDLSDNMWNVEDIWLLQQQHFSNTY